MKKSKGALSYISEIYAPPLSQKQIDFLLKLQPRIIHQDTGISRYLILTATKGGKIPRSVHQQFLDYIDSLKKQVKAL